MVEHTLAYEAVHQLDQGTARVHQARNIRKHILLVGWLEERRNESLGLRERMTDLKQIQLVLTCQLVFQLLLLVYNFLVKRLLDAINLLLFLLIG